MTAALFVSMSAFCFADDWYYVSDPHIIINGPAASEDLTFYTGEYKGKAAGETIKADMTFKEAWPSPEYESWPVIYLCMRYDFGQCSRIRYYPAMESGTVSHKWNISTKGLYAGKYHLHGELHNFDYRFGDDEFVYGNDTSLNDWRKSYIYLEIRNLDKPKKLKAKAKRRNVKLTYSSVEGATRYIIYRSTKKNSKYKVIARTGKLKYTDKKVKKGKRYYYQVRAERNNGLGIVQSKTTKAVRTKRVK